MKITRDDGWELLTIEPHESLTNVPSQFDQLLTPNIRSVFADATVYFQNLSKNCPFPAMTAWLSRMFEAGSWQLNLFHWEVAGSKWGGFQWSAISQALREGDIIIVLDDDDATWRGSDNTAIPTGATICLPEAWDFDRFPPAIQKLHTLVGQIRWSNPGHAGSLKSPSDVRPVTEHFAFNGDPNGIAGTTFAWGTTHCGETMVFNLDGRAGWMSSSGRIDLEMTVEQMIDWLFGELLQGNEPARPDRRK